jgi:hypothetical protein
LGSGYLTEVQHLLPALDFERKRPEKTDYMTVLDGRQSNKRGRNPGIKRRVNGPKAIKNMDINQLNLFLASYAGIAMGMSHR